VAAGRVASTPTSRTWAARCLADIAARARVTQPRDAARAGGRGDGTGVGGALRTGREEAAGEEAPGEEAPGEEAPGEEAPGEEAPGGGDVLSDGSSAGWGALVGTGSAHPVSTAGASTAAASTQRARVCRRRPGPVTPRP
jgi:hypothetical protein